jgi:hypothetical protein
MTSRLRYNPDYRQRLEGRLVSVFEQLARHDSKSACHAMQRANFDSPLQLLLRGKLMSSHKILFALHLTFAAAMPSAIGQSSDVTPAPVAATAATAVPSLIRYTGMVPHSNGKALAGESSITFLIFKDEKGGEPLWAETQMTVVDEAGKYNVQLGATSPSGLQSELFTSGEARWLEVQVAGSVPQSRILLASVPYAMKAADATTLGGLPASAFMLAGTRAAVMPSTVAAVVSPEVSTNAVTTPGGVAGFLPVYNGATSIDDSMVFESGTKIGIGTNTPAATLDVNGNVAARGALALESNGIATAAIGRNSQPLQFFANVFSATTKTAFSPIFALQAEAFGNNTTASSGTLNLLYGNGTTPTETGLSFSSRGLIKFAAGQTFPGSGTITGVTTISPLAGSGTSGSVALSLNLPVLETTLNTKYAQLAAANRFTAPVAFALPVTFAATQTFPGTGKGTITGVTTTAPLTGSGVTGSVAIGLNLPALETTLNTKYPQLAAANKFTAPVAFGAPVAFSVPVTFAATQTFPGIPGGGTITGITTTSPLAGAGTRGSVALSLNLPALESTLNTQYARLTAANTFTQPITFAATQTFPGTSAITGVVAGAGLIGGGTTGAVKLSLDPKVIPTLTSSPVFSSISSDGIVGGASGSVLNTAGVLGEAGARSGVSSVVAGVWGDAYQQVGVEGTSNQTVGVYGQSNVSSGVQGVSTAGNGVLGNTVGNTLGTAGVHGIAGSGTSFGGIAGVWGEAAAHVGVLGASNQYSGVQGWSVSGPGIQGTSTSGSGGTFSSSGNLATIVSTNTGTTGASALYASTVAADAVSIDAISTGPGGYGMAAYATGATDSLGRVPIGIFGYSSGNGMLGQTTGSIGGTAGVLGVAGGRSGSGGIAGVWGDAVGHVAVFGSSAGETGVYGLSSTSNGVHGLSGQSAGIASIAGVSGDCYSCLGVFGVSVQAAGVDGVSVNNVGVQGASKKVGVYGVGGTTEPNINRTFSQQAVGIWGDVASGAAADGIAVVGTAGTGQAALFQNNSASAATLSIYNANAVSNAESNSLFTSFVAATPEGSCGFGGKGDLTCTGQVKTLATTGGGSRTVETYAMQSPENWMEDFGSGTLHNGSTTITLDAAFAETTSEIADYHVFLTPNGDSKGLYVIAKTSTSFEVRESGGGQSTLGFDYRIVARRRGFETQRMTDVTEQFRTERARIDTQTKIAKTISEKH